MKDKQGGVGRLIARLVKNPLAPVKTFTSQPRLRLTFRTPWQRWWWQHRRLQRVSIFSLTLVMVLVAGSLVRFWLLANQIIVGDKRAAALADEVDPKLLEREGDGRINVLLAGVGGEGHMGGDLSDSIMIASLDPLSKELAMISLPRDLYLPITGYGTAKINAAHAYGEQMDYPGGGVKLLADTITENFGLPIHYFVRIDFDGFRQAIDLLGGVDVDVAKPITDYSYPRADLNGYEPFKLAAGAHHLDGELALKYARSRYSTSDFDRAKRQQQLLLALKDKALSAGTYLDPIKVNSLLSITAKHARTNISLEDGTKLLDLIKQVDGDQIKRTNLDSSKTNLLVSQVIDGLWVLTPTNGDFGSLRRYIFQLAPDSFIKKEAARVRVLNGTKQAGLAQAIANLLASYGYQVVEVTNHSVSANTRIIDHSNGQKPYTLHYLTKRFGNSEVGSPHQLADITIILGNDYHPAE